MEEKIDNEKRDRMARRILLNCRHRRLMRRMPNRELGKAIEKVFVNQMPLFSDQEVLIEEIVRRLKRRRPCAS